MAPPLPRKVTDLIGRTVYWQDKAEDTPVPATVVDARWTGMRHRDGTERPGIQFLLDNGEHMQWSMAYIAPVDDPDPTLDE